MARGTFPDVGHLISLSPQAAFATGSAGQIIAWNRPASHLLGHSAREVLGLDCHEALCRDDHPPDRTDDAPCTPARSAARGEITRPIRTWIRRASFPPLRASLSSLVLSGNGSGGFAVVHLLHPLGCGSRGEVDAQAAASDPRSSPGEERDGAAGPLAALTRREAEVLRLLAQGAGTAGIARELRISTPTVRNHVQNVFRTLGVHSRVEAVALALQAPRRPLA